MIYDERYAADYPRLYIAPWSRKHERNVAYLRPILEQLAARRDRPRWLDAACGPAWHFTRFPSGCRQVGLDLSAAQLRRARSANPQAVFVQGDMSRSVFAPGSFDLVTSFWAGYCYLDDFGRIASFLENLIAWVRSGGACYLEVLLGEDVAGFRASRFAAVTGFEVFARTPDFLRWGYRDTGGEHLMTSPRLEFFTAPLARAFEQIESEHDGAFMVHLRALGRRPPGSGPARLRP